MSTLEEINGDYIQKGIESEIRERILIDREKRKEIYLQHLKHTALAFAAQFTPSMEIDRRVFNEFLKRNPDIQKDFDRI